MAFSSGDKNQVEKPKRPMSAYNVFFQKERQRILNEIPDKKRGKSRKYHGKISFASLARCVAAKWKNLDPQERAYYKNIAAEDKERYKQEKEEWEASITETLKQTQNSTMECNSQLQSNTATYGFTLDGDDLHSLDMLQNQCGDLGDNADEGVLTLGLDGTWNQNVVGIAMLPLPINPPPALLSTPNILDLAKKLDTDCRAFLCSLLE